MLVEKDEITIRLMDDKQENYQLMAKWLSDERVLEFYEGRDNPFDLSKVIESYQPMVRGNDTTKPCFIYSQNITIGYLQYYSLDDLPQADKQKYCLGKTDNVYRLDLFIGEPNYWHRGIGTKVLTMAVNYIFEVFLANKVVVDPRVENTRAIRCYEKVGFAKVRLLPAHELHEGKYSDCWLMAIEGKKSLH
jgi:aminoglycoside 6'-N-acetyltransferase